MIIREFFDPNTYTLTYVVHNEGSREAIIIDPVLDFDPATGFVTEESNGKILEYLQKHELSLTHCLETHAHADHLSSAQILKKYYPNLKVAISRRITDVQDIFVDFFNLDAPKDGSQFDILFEDMGIYNFAGLNIKVIPSPGHTPACSSYLIEDSLFTGDSVFMPDYGVGRCDFPGGSAISLYESVTKNLYTLADETKVFVGHDYQPNGRALKFQTTIRELKTSNVQLNENTSESDFVDRRTSRDKTLPAPKLLLPSVQFNIVAGKAPEPKKEGFGYLKIPLRLK